ncbi:MAG: type I methionyl aminopeptidase, partial [Byssovorax sp.]
FTIEPMINLGRHEYRELDDGWTIVTRDGSLSAQFEHTLAVTTTGCEILTRRDRPLANSEGLRPSDVLAERAPVP